MSSVCISRCLKDARDPRAPVVRATYVNLYKWPESDAEFIRSVSSNSRGGGGVCRCPPRVVDSISCRQMYLRSYPFSREEDRRRPPPDVAWCFGWAREKVRRNSEARGGGFCHTPGREAEKGSGSGTERDEVCGLREGEGDVLGCSV